MKHSKSQCNTSFQIRKAFSQGNTLHTNYGLYLITAACMLFDPRDRRVHSLDLSFTVFFKPPPPPLSRADKDTAAICNFEHLHSLSSSQNKPRLNPILAVICDVHKWEVGGKKISVCVCGGARRPLHQVNESW